MSTFETRLHAQSFAPLQGGFALPRRTDVAS